MIEVDELGKTYPGADTPALQGVTFRVPEGSVFGLLGPNGAGKSTLIGIVLGLIRADRGSVRVDGADTHGGAVRPAVIGMVPQEPAFYPSLTVRENLEIFAAVRGFRGRSRADELARVADIARLGEHMRASAGRLSGGLKRRLSLAIGLLGSPRVLCLDEPTTGVDPQSRRFILESVEALAADRGITVIYASHYMEEVQDLCDHLAILDQGRLLCTGAMADVLGRQQRSLALRFPAPPGRGQLEALADAFLVVDAAGDTVSLDIGDPLAALPTLAGLLRDNDLRPESFHYGEQDLEALFLRLTGRQLRD
ncbi:ABC transporter ATP-binding protein [Aquisalimonas lutea]|uniref:ABC transporter ATP-binding protein n=1 Tax=Aquisalimonas lutea TaxID=1327750 RepID=UPI0025B53CFF|nr:ABC transporter ATP-binding protein [Aquisalimonas lutea]MDN3517103.1 ABC transporter ATP-binding protein [Aquisalimonas lutea]